MNVAIHDKAVMMKMFMASLKVVCFQFFTVNSNENNLERCCLAIVHCQLNSQCRAVVVVHHRQHVVEEYGDGVIRV